MATDRRRQSERREAGREQDASEREPDEAARRATDGSSRRRAAMSRRVEHGSTTRTRRTDDVAASRRPSSARSASSTRRTSPARSRSRSSLSKVGRLRLDRARRLGSRQIGEPHDEIVMPVAALVGARHRVLLLDRDAKPAQLAEEVASELSKVTWPSRTRSRTRPSSSS